VSGHLSYPGFPDLPVATIQGDGFGGPGKGGKAIPIDAEGIVLNPDGGFWISDEYGPYVYRFDAAGRMVGAIRPPQAIIPMRKWNRLLLRRLTNLLRNPPRRRQRCDSCG
jgi:hypothetical protein